MTKQQQELKARLKSKHKKQDHVRTETKIQELIKFYLLGLLDEKSLYLKALTIMNKQ